MQREPMSRKSPALREKKMSPHIRPRGEENQENLAAVFSDRPVKCSAVIDLFRTCEGNRYVKSRTNGIKAPSMRNSQAVCTFLLLAFTLIVGEDENIYVRISQGLLRGKSMTSRNGSKFHAFLKVPYARPPLGELRFKAPQEPAPWEGVRDATRDGVICTQRNIYVKTKFFVAGEEDCLYLNVYTPKVNRTDEELLPVMFFIHGGGWVTGSGNSFYYPPHYLMDKDIVYVSLNYRLGPLGFLSMEDADLPGNLGLKDQNQALKWVQRNIKAFGGNPKSVTIFGESAGGASVHYHMMSPKSKGLFHKGISQSGTALCSWALGHSGVTRNNTIKVAEVLKCPTSPTAAMADCLRKKPVEDIITTDVHFMEWFKEPMIPFKPVVEKLAREEDRFIAEHPEDAIRNGNVADVPWMTGINSGDGALRVAGFYDDYNLVKELDKDFHKIVPMSLFYREKVSDVPGVTKLIREFYFGDAQVNNDTFQSVTDLWTDGWFLAGTDDAVRLMYKGRTAPIYYYYFSYRGTLSFSSVFGDPTRDYGVCHADELIYLFPTERLFPNVSFTELDQKYMNIMLEFWTNFAKFGDPTPNEVEGKWEPVATEGLEYFHFGRDEIAMSSNLLPERTKFWASLKSPREMRRDEL